MTAVLLAVGCGPGATVQLARADLQRGHHDSAERKVDRALLCFPRDPALWQVKIAAAFGRRDTRGAVAAYQQFRDHRDADHPATLRGMAVATLRQALAAPAPVIQTLAIQVVDRLQVEELSAAVAALVTDKDHRVAAAAAVARLPAAAEAARIATELLASDMAEARAIAAEGLARKVGLAARADLVPLLDDRDARVRRAAVRALGSLGAGRDGTRLAAISHRDPDGRVRVQALAALAPGSPPSGILEIATVASRDPYLGVRLAAVSLLARAGAAGSDQLSQLSGSRDTLVALRAAIALHRRGRHTPALLLRAHQDPSWVVRAAAVHATAALTPRARAIRLLGARLADARPEVRVAAARSLLLLGDNPRSRQELASALSCTTAPSPNDVCLGINGLRPAAREQLGLAAARWLAGHDPRSAVAGLGRLVRSPRPSTRAAAILAHRTAGQVSPALVAALADSEPRVRLAAAETLLGLANVN